MVTNDPTPREVVAGIVIEQWRSAQESLNDFGQRIHDELVARPDLLVRMLRVPRPGPCGDVAPVIGNGPSPVCTLDVGHSGCHKAGDYGAIWREVDNS